MATKKHPDDKRDLKKAADQTKATPREARAPHVDVQKPHEDKQAAQADKARRDTAADAFRQEKAHEPSPRRHP
jgi:hypothetical protein